MNVQGQKEMRPPSSFLHTHTHPKYQKAKVVEMVRVVSSLFGLRLFWMVGWMEDV